MRTIPTPLFDLGALIHFVARFHGNQPDHEATRQEGQDTRSNLEPPGVREVIDVGVAIVQPEVLALKTEGVVGKHHDCCHQEHA